MAMPLNHVPNRSYRERGRGQVWTHLGGGYVPGRSFGGGRMTGPVRRGALGLNARPSSYVIAKRRPNSFPWRHDLFQDSLRAAGMPGIENGSKLHISNLDYGVSKDDIKDLFCEIGDLERFAIHYNSNGQPSGSAEVVYKRRSDAFAAMKRYNNVMLDGKLMKIDVVGANAEIPISARVSVTGLNGRTTRTVVFGAGLSHRSGFAAPRRDTRPGLGRRGGFAAPGSDTGRNRQGAMRNVGDRRWPMRGQTRFQVKKSRVKSVEELDKELDSYRAEPMQV